MFFQKGAQAGGRTWDLLVFVYFLSLKQRLRPLGYCAPLSNVLNVCDSLFRSRFKFLYYKSHSNLKGQGKSNMTLPLFDVRSHLSTDKVLNQL